MYLNKRTKQCKRDTIPLSYSPTWIWSWEESNPRLSRFSLLNSDDRVNISKYIYTLISPFFFPSDFKAVIGRQMTVKIHSKLIEAESGMNMANSLLSGRPNVCVTHAVSVTLKSNLICLEYLASEIMPK